LKIREQIVREAPGNDTLAQSLADTNDSLGDLYVSIKSYEEAGQRLNAAADLRERLAKRLPDNFQRQSRLVRTYMRIGNLLVNRGDIPAALTRYRTALGIVEKVLSNSQMRYRDRKEAEGLSDDLLTIIRRLS
jgi:tetratricopeptide (TPR) repeat protein